MSFKIIQLRFMGIVLSYIAMTSKTQLEKACKELIEDINDKFSGK